MGATNYGLIEMGSYLMGLNPNNPDYCAFGFSGSPFDATQAYLGSEIDDLRKAITWTWDGTNPKGTASLATTDGVGSTIEEVGIATGAILGSNLFFRELSAIGDKTNAFNVVLTFNVRLSRPNE